MRTTPSSSAEPLSTLVAIAEPLGGLTSAPSLDLVAHQRGSIAESLRERVVSFSSLDVIV